VDERYQLDATIVIYHKYLYMFRGSICPSSGVQVLWCCIWCSALGVVAVVLQHTTCTPEDGHIDVRNVEILFMIINHNCCIKLVPLVIFTVYECLWISQITLSPPTFYDVGAWIRI